MRHVGDTKSVTWFCERLPCAFPHVADGCRADLEKNSLASENSRFKDRKQLSWFFLEVFDACSQTWLE